MFSIDEQKLQNFYYLLEHKELSSKKSYINIIILMCGDLDILGTQLIKLFY